MTTEDLVAALEAALGTRVGRIERRRSPYRTSFLLDEVDVDLADGRRLELVLKGVDRRSLGPAARVAKPAVVHDSRREIQAYRLLANAGLGTPELVAAGTGWLLLERVRGLELSRIGDLDVWRAAARWLARLHERFASEPPRSPRLLERDADFLWLWPRRALELGRDEIQPIASRYVLVVDRLLGLPRTLVHGEFYPSNVIVAEDGSRLAPVDWELAGTGPGLIDLAALVAGWGEREAQAIVDAYGPVDPGDLDCCRLQLALQWLGWAARWTPPREHATDWLGEALAAARRLELV